MMDAKFANLEDVESSFAREVAQRILKYEEENTKLDRKVWWSKNIEVYSGSLLTPLIHGDSYFKRLLSELQKAKKYVYITGWVMGANFPLTRAPGKPANDSVNKASDIAKVLLDLAKKNVEVRIVVWRNFLNILDLDSLYFKRSFAESKVLVRELHNPVLHQKSVIIDGQIAFCGGIDISTLGGDHWDTDNHINVGPPDKPYQRFKPHPKATEFWHDVQLMISGKAVKVLEKNFVDRWMDTVRINDPDPPPSPVISSIGGAGKIHLQVIRTIPKVETRIESIHDGSGSENGWFDPRPTQLGIKSRFIEEYSALESYGRAIINAQHFIYIENQYFSCKFLIELLARRLNANKKLSLVVLLPKKSEIAALNEIKSQNIGQWFSRKVASEPVIPARVIKELINIDEKRLFFVSPINEQKRDVYVHAKVMIIDDIYATIGSVNFGNRSMFMDLEMGIAWLDENKKSIKDLRQTLWSEHLGIEKEKIPDFDDNKKTISSFWKERLSDPTWKPNRIIEWKPSDSVK